jgi:hypothetical protein
MSQQNLPKMIMLMRILIFIVVVIELLEPILAYVGDEELFLEINNEIWRKRISELALTDTVFLMAFVYMVTAIWLFGVYQIERLCRLYSKGIIFSAEAIRRFKYFAISLAFIAFVESIEFSVVVGYLWAREIIPAMPDMSPLDYFGLVEIDVFLVAIFFSAIASVMETGVEIQRDKELTI